MTVLPFAFSLLAHYLLRYAKINATGVGKLFQRTNGTLSRQLASFDCHPEKYFSFELLKNIEGALNDAAMAL